MKTTGIVPDCRGAALRSAPMLHRPGSIFVALTLALACGDPVLGQGALKRNDSSTASVVEPTAIEALAKMGAYLRTLK